MMTLLTMTDKSSVAQDIVDDVTDDVSSFKTYFDTKLPEIISLGIKVILAIIVFFIGRLVIKWVCNLIRKSLERSAADKGVEQFIYSLSKAVLYVLLVLILVTNLGVETTSIAAIVASAGVAVGLALQGSLSNFAGGILILLLKPFSVGDYIIEDSHKNEGTVIEIQLFYTILSTVDNKRVIIPNGTLANASMTNVTARDIRQLDLRICISYQADLKKAKQVIEELLTSNEEIIKEEDHSVFVSDLEAQGVVIGIRGWVKTEAFSSVRWELLEKIKLGMDECGVMMTTGKIVC